MNKHLHTFLKMKKRLSECDNEEEEGNSKKEHGKHKSKKKVKKEEEEEEEINISPEMQQQCSYILEHLNLKMQLVTWKPT